MKKTNQTRALKLSRLTIKPLQQAKGSAPPGMWWNNNQSYDNECSGSCNTCVDGQCGSWESGYECSMDCAVG